MAQRQLECPNDLSLANSEASDDEVDFGVSDIADCIDRSLPHGHEDEFMELSDNDHNLEEAARKFVENLDAGRPHGDIKVKKEPVAEFRELGTAVKTEDEWMPFETVRLLSFIIMHKSLSHTINASYCKCTNFHGVL
jgi:hypothetical protein